MQLIVLILMIFFSTPSIAALSCEARIDTFNKRHKLSDQHKHYRSITKIDLKESMMSEQIVSVEKRSQWGEWFFPKYVYSIEYNQKQFHYSLYFYDGRKKDLIQNDLLAITSGNVVVVRSVRNDIEFEIECRK